MYSHLFAFLSEELSDENYNFRNPVTKSADIFKNAVLPEKSKLLEKIRHFLKFKNFFHASKVYELNLHTNKFPAQKHSDS